MRDGRGRKSSWLGWRGRATLVLFVLLVTSSLTSDWVWGEDAIDRLTADRLASVRQAIERLRSERQTPEVQRPWKDLRANLHVHSSFSHDSRGKIEEIVAAAKAVGTQVVMFNEHPADHYDFYSDGHRGLREGVLLIPGAETKGLLVFPKHSLRGAEAEQPQGYSNLVRGRGGLSFVSHLEERMDWELAGINGVEIYNTHADFKDEQRLVKSLRNPLWLFQAAELFRKYPQEAFSSLQDYPGDYLRRWDALNRRFPHVGVSANDAHQNVGVVVRMGAGGRPVLEDGSGKKLLDLEPLLIAPLVRIPADAKEGDVIFDWKMDPYECSLRHVATHLLATELSEESVWDALEKGRAYVAFDWMADASGFDLAVMKAERRYEMGERISNDGKLEIVALSPLSARWKVVRDGEVIHENDGRELRYPIQLEGCHRIELWLKVADIYRPWILSSPFYITRM